MRLDDFCGALGFVSSSHEGGWEGDCVAVLFVFDAFYFGVSAYQKFRYIRDNNNPRANNKTDSQNGFAGTYTSSRNLPLDRSGGVLGFHKNDQPHDCL